jgi:hypothetical protein
VQRTEILKEIIEIRYIYNRYEFTNTRIMKKQWIAILIAGMTPGTAWAIRGQFGHEQGTAWAGEMPGSHNRF